MNIQNQLINPDDALSLVGMIILIRAKNRLKTDATLLQEILCSARSGCIKIFYDSDETPEGYITWCEITPDTLKQIARHHVRPCYQYEWREGHITFILDAFCPRLRNKLALLKGRSPVAWINARGKLKIYGN